MYNKETETVNTGKKLYDVFVSYSALDRPLAEEVIYSLMSNGVSVWYAPECIPAGTTYASSIDNAIASSRFFMPIITKSFADSKWCLAELDSAVCGANNRSKTILPIVFDRDAIRNSELEFYIIGHQWIQPERNSSSIKEVTARISSIISEANTDAVRFEKLSEYIDSGADDKATEILCELIIKVSNDILKGESSDRKENCLKLLSYLEKTVKLYSSPYGDNARKLAHKKLDAIDTVTALWKSDVLDKNNLYFISVILRLIYLDRLIRYDCADAITGGDVSDGIVDPNLSEEKYADIQSHYLDIYRQLQKQDTSTFNKAEMEFILSTEQYIYTKLEAVSKNNEETTYDQSLLRAVADFTRKGNKLFDTIGNDRPARDFLQCLLLSYERLKNYCQVVGAQEVCVECIDRIAELKQQLSKPPVTDNKADSTAEAGIKSLLGLTDPHSGKYDVFISHKNEDYDIALDIYEFLNENLKESFLDKKSLPEMSESKYRKAIMSALDGSKHFVVVFSDVEYLKSEWVSLEMEVFQAEQDEGRKPDSNFLMIVTENVYDEIMKSKKSVIPIDYRRCEIVKLQDYKNTLLNYLNR